jgi:Mg2+ and Co2+ transporter CorA
VDRLERSAETAVQMHFNLESNRANDVMKTLTAVTAIFLAA